MTNVNTTVPDDGCVTVTNFSTFTSEDMAPGVIDKATPGFSAFIPFSGGLIHTVADDYQPFFQQGQWIFSLAPNAQFTDPLVLTNFTELYDEFNNNIIGDLSGEGVTLFFPVDPSLFTNNFFDVTTNMKLYNFSGAEYTVENLSQDSGDVPKGTSEMEAYTALAADFDGDGKADPAKYMETNGIWQVMLSGSGYAIINFTLGGTGYTPVAGDFVGDGRADPAVYQKNIGDWEVRLDGDPDRPVYFNLGDEASRPVTGDFDGDRKADPAVYQTSTSSWIIMLSDGGYAPLTLTDFLGGSSYTALAADFDSDGLVDPTVYQASSGTWIIKLSGSGYAATSLTGFLGGSGYTPLAADFDGDGLADPAIYNLTSSTWQVLLSSNAYTPVTFIF